MTILNAPSSAAVHSELGNDDGRTTILAQVDRGPFTATVSRWDGRDGSETFVGAPRIGFDSSQQDGEEMFRDLTVLPQHVEDFAAVVTEIVDDYRKITTRTAELRRDEVEVQESL